jgi:septum formation protein
MTLQAAHPRLVLASASPARRAVLAAAGLAAEVRPANVDEAGLRQAAQAEGLAADDTALMLAAAKARFAARADPAALAIGCDQILVCEDRWFDKPADIGAAREQLRALRGHTHTLVTAVVCQRGEQWMWHHVARPRLTMRGFSDAFLDEYLRLEAGYVTASVGAYRLEGPGVHLFDRVEGEHAAILGLPLLALLGFLRRQGVLAD